ncbi:MAG: serine/threonine protein kinase, partial [Lachnospiraceae bacterium]|nr:serine/threonine protein kinase [Lachnospiraceae bacterium]
MAEFKRCYACMEDINGELICPHCGFNVIEHHTKLRCLKPGSVLNNRYTVGIVLGEGGFGITYIGWDNTLDLPVAIKEYFPVEMASRDNMSSHSDEVNVYSGKKEQLYFNGLSKFISEAKTLSKFNNLIGIVSVRDFFSLNNTAYIIMDFNDGVTMKEYIDENGPLKSEYVFELMKPVMYSLEYVHRKSIVHRDISPDNIMISTSGTVQLIDFGAARTINKDDDKKLTVVLKKGYGPEEQYRSNGNQGPWTDVYALCATMYYMITGREPVESITRIVEDNLIPISSLGYEIGAEEESVLMKGLAVFAKDRYQSMNELYKAFYGETIISDDEGGSIEYAIKVGKEREKNRQNIGKVISDTNNRSSENRSGGRGMSSLSMKRSFERNTGNIDDQYNGTVLMDDGTNETVLMDDGNNETVLMED